MLCFIVFGVYLLRVCLLGLISLFGLGVDSVVLIAGYFGVLGKWLCFVRVLRVYGGLGWVFWSLVCDCLVCLCYCLDLV